MENQKFDSLTELQKNLSVNPDLQQSFKHDPVKALKEVMPNPLNTDYWIYRIVVLSLGLTVVIIIIGVIVLTGMGLIRNDQNVPTILTAIGSASIGALAGLLAPAPTSK